jgi:ABC-type antimicrobial peptide transport system permease subunit
MDDEKIEPSPMMMVYHPFAQELGGGRVFVRASGDPYALVPAIARIVREIAADQPVERASTLADVRAEVLAPNRLNAIVFGGFAAVALAISVVGVAGVLAFSVSARTREFGIRLAVGSQPRRLLAGVLLEGASMAALGVAAGVTSGLVLTRLAGAYIRDVQLPGALPLIGSASVIVAAALVAAAVPAARAARVDVMRALRTD